MVEQGSIVRVAALLLLILISVTQMAGVIGAHDVIERMTDGWKQPWHEGSPHSHSDPNDERESVIDALRRIEPADDITENLNFAPPAPVYAKEKLNVER